MVTTPNLNITHVEQAQANKETTINTAFDRFDNSVNDNVNVVCTAGGTITVTSTDKLDNYILVLTGTPGAAFNLDIPDGDRDLKIINTSGQTATIDTVSGSATIYALANGNSVRLTIIGVNINFDVAGGGGGSLPGGATFGRKSEYIPAAAMQPSVTKPCSALQVIEGTAGNPNIHVRDFDPGVAAGGAVDLEEAQFQFPMPNRWNKGTLVFEVFDTHAGGQSAGLDGRVWGLSAVAISNDEAWNTAFGTEVLVTIDQANANRIHRSAESAALTVAGTPTDDDFTFFRIRRKTDDAADDMDIDARLLGVRIYWIEDAAVDD